MAEQAINTIYALGDHPDVLCNDLIKTVTRRVFGGERKSRAPSKDPNAMDEDSLATEGETKEDESTSTPKPTQATSGDVGDAFELGQLLFVVGHVAIKRIVYLEPVERG